MIKYRLPLAFALACILPTAVAQEQWPAPPRADKPSPVRMELLRRGDVLVETIREDGKGGAARVRALFRAEPEQVWQVLGDCEANFRFVQGLRECEVLEQSPEHAITRQVAKKHWLSPELGYRFETRREPYSWIMIRLLDGDLENLDGSWRFDPVKPGGLLLVTHEIAVKPRMPSPRWLVRRTLSRDLEEMVACLRYVADASLDDSGRDRDREQCPDPDRNRG